VRILLSSVPSDAIRNYVAVRIAALPHGPYPKDVMVPMLATADFRRGLFSNRKRKTRQYGRYFEQESSESWAVDCRRRARPACHP
jgi:hypothetical protein